MKKLLSALLLLSLLLSLLACGKEETTTAAPSTTTNTTTTTNNNNTTTTTTSPSTTQGSQTTTPAPAKTVYDLLRELAKESYREVDVAISTTAEGITLHASYQLTATKVSYSVERLAKLPTDGTADHLPENGKIILAGTVAAEKGKPTYIAEIDTTLPACDDIAGQFDYSEKHFNSITQSEGVFSATVNAPEAFLGADSQISHMEICITYTPDALSTLTLTYFTPTATVSVVYTFTK